MATESPLPVGETRSRTTWFAPAGTLANVTATMLSRSPLVGRIDRYLLADRPGGDGQAEGLGVAVVVNHGHHDLDIYRPDRRRQRDDLLLARYPAVGRVPIDVVLAADREGDEGAGVPALIGIGRVEDGKRAGRTGRWSVRR